MKHILPLLFILVTAAHAGSAIAQSNTPARSSVEITSRPRGLVHGTVTVPVSGGEDVHAIGLVINGVPFAEMQGNAAVFQVPIGEYIRRLRVRAVGYDRDHHPIGQDEMSVNDPQPPFRIRLFGPSELPEKGTAELTASVSAPLGIAIRGVDFYVGNQIIGTDDTPPYSASFRSEEHPGARYATVTARAAGDLRAYDVYFWGTDPREEIDVRLQQLPLSVAGERVPRLSELELLDDGKPKKIEGLVPASDQPLNVVLLLDSSESMLEELPVVKQAARQFVRALIRPSDKYAVVAFAQQTTWLTGLTSDVTAVDRAVEQLYPRGETHLYDAVIETLYEMQKLPGRKALVVVTDGVNQGGSFELDHLIHYARYAGVPVYPVIKNRLLSRFMRFGLRGFAANKFASIAEDSGATYFIIRSPSELSGVYRKIASELQHQQVLMFYSHGTVRDEWHGLTLRWEGGDDRKLRIPRGYFP